MIRPLGNRILVKLLPRYGEEENKLGIVIVDQKRHYEGVRRGEVMAVSELIHSVKAGDVVLFPGDLGTSFGLDEAGGNDGTEWRRLRISEVLAVEEMMEVA